MSDPTFGNTAETAPPKLRELYQWLAPDPNAEYGTSGLVPAARDGNTGAVRPAMPMAVRNLLTGGLDTGELTPRAAATITMGGLGAGGSLAPRGALAAGAARRATRLPMDRASIDARSRAQGYLLEPGTDDFLTVYHGTNREISPGFRLNPPERTTNAASAEAGIWASTRPEVAQRYAEHAARAGEPTDGMGPSVLPLRARAEKDGVLRLEPGMKEREILGALRDAWDAGYDAIRVTGYTTPDGLPAPDNWVFKNPNQLRVPWAAFDPAKRDSSDLLAGFAVPGPTPVPGFNFSPAPERTPGFNMQPQPDPVRPFRNWLSPDGGA